MLFWATWERFLPMTEYITYVMFSLSGWECSPMTSHGPMDRERTHLIYSTGAGLASAMVYLTPDMNGTIPSGHCRHGSWTCRGRCREAQQSYIFADGADGSNGCHCDKLCLYLGDCCYNYLRECRSKNFTLEEGIKKQAEIFLQWKSFIQCLATNIKAAVCGARKCSNLP